MGLGGRSRFGCLWRCGSSGNFRLHQIGQATEEHTHGSFKLKGKLPRQRLSFRIFPTLQKPSWAQFVQYYKKFSETRKKEEQNRKAKEDRFGHITAILT
jgi:hypothetical protein